MQPPASLKALGDPIYEAFYGLKEQPFAISTDPRFFYLSASHQRAFSELLNGLRRHESILLVTGETGTGKTTLCRAVLETLGDRTFSALILNPYMSGAEVLRIVLRDFGFVSHEDLRRGAMATADVPQLLDTLEGFLTSLQTLAGHAVIVIDEAQSLAPAILDQIRLLTALEHDHRRLVQVVLCGQPSLLGTIKTEPMHALNERITRRVELAPLSADDVDGYIQHRLGVAGGGETIRFDPAATAAIADLSRGLPRRINVLCDRALQEGRIEGANLITTDLVKRAARALAGVHDPIPAAVPPPPAPVAPRPDVAAAHTEPERTAPRDPRRESSEEHHASPRAAREASAEPTTEPAAGAAEDVNPFVDLPGLSFGQKPEAEPKPFRNRALAAAAGLGLVAAGYLMWAWSAGPVAAAIPPAPTTRVLNTGAPAAALAVPAPAELEALLTEPIVRRTFAPAIDPPAGEFAPGPVPASGQNPDNSNQIN